jgi:SAM-dependent methyltransferase
VSSTNTVPEWCGAAAARRVYQGPIRAGKFGQQTVESYQVLECDPHGLQYLSPFPVVDYSDDSYRIAVNDSADIEQYFRLHGPQQPGYLRLIQPYLQAGQVVADVGCGGGALLDLVKTETGGKTIAIEPFTGYHDSLATRDHRVYSTVEEVRASVGSDFVDVALSIHVIEHTVDPVEYLQDVHALVRPGGVLIVVTPNLNDFLMHADPARMAPFFYRRVHNYYFTAESLGWVGSLAGWEPAEPLFYHEFGMSNALLWLRDATPSGHTRLAGIDESADHYWIEYLQKTGQANNLGIVLRKPR